MKIIDEVYVESKSGNETTIRLGEMQERYDHRYVITSGDDIFYTLSRKSAQSKFLKLIAQAKK